MHAGSPASQKGGDPWERREIMSTNSSLTESERQDTQNDQIDVIQPQAPGPSQPVARAPGVRHVFISHKAKDELAAEAIRKALKMRGGNSLEIFVSERIKAGSQWSEEIWKSLKRADWLLLLYTDPSQEWDWCLFEAGFFAGAVENLLGRKVDFKESRCHANAPNRINGTTAYHSHCSDC